MNGQIHPEGGRQGPGPRSQALYLDLGPRVQKKVEKLYYFIEYEIVCFIVK